MEGGQGPQRGPIGGGMARSDGVPAHGGKKILRFALSRSVSEILAIFCLDYNIIGLGGGQADDRRLAGGPLDREFQAL